MSVPILLSGGALHRIWCRAPFSGTPSVRSTGPVPCPSALRHPLVRAAQPPKPHAAPPPRWGSIPGEGPGTERAPRVVALTRQAAVSGPLGPVSWCRVQIPPISPHSHCPDGHDESAMTTPRDDRDQMPYAEASTAKDHSMTHPSITNHDSQTPNTDIAARDHDDSRSSSPTTPTTQHHETTTRRRTLEATEVTSRRTSGTNTSPGGQKRHERSPGSGEGA